MRRLATAALAFAGTVSATTLVVPNGTLEVSDVRFLRAAEFGTVVPETTFTLANHSLESWNSVKLQFTFAGVCGGKEQRWTIPIATMIMHFDSMESARQIKDTSIPLVGTVNGCTATGYDVKLLALDGANYAVEGENITDKKEEARKLEVEHQAEVAEQARVDAIAAKKAAVAAAQRRKLAAVKKAKEAKEAAELDERIAKREADRQAELEVTATKIRAYCGSVYAQTAWTKQSDLTMKEKKAVDACDYIGQYHE